MPICGVDSLMVRFRAHTPCIQLCGLFLACLGWFLCIYAASIGQWRQWRIEKSPKYQTDVMWIGIWDACYDSATSDDDYYDQNCKPFSAQHDFLPKEIVLAQDLMTVGAVLATVALGFFFFAYWIIIKDKKRHGITSTFLATGGFLSLTTGTLVLIPVLWNMLSVLNNEKIDFPESFDMPSHPKQQYVGIAIYLGLVSGVSLTVTGLLFLGHNKCLLIHKRVHPLDPEKGSEHSSEDGQDQRTEATSNMSFQIPMGPVPEQRGGV